MRESVNRPGANGQVREPPASILQREELGEMGPAATVGGTEWPHLCGTSCC